MLDALGIQRGSRFLDVASGPGYLAAAARRRGADVAGVDFSVSMVEKARRGFPGLAFRVGDAGRKLRRTGHQLRDAAFVPPRASARRSVSRVAARAWAAEVLPSRRGPGRKKPWGYPWC
nr:methyltransferase domain-containing protein [Paraburkholderia sacchari]